MRKKTVREIYTDRVIILKQLPPFLCAYDRDNEICKIARRMKGIIKIAAAGSKKESSFITKRVNFDNSLIRKQYLPASLTYD